MDDRDDRDFGWSGGWEDAQDGGDHAEDVALFGPYPYDLPGSFIPADRWATGFRTAGRQPWDERFEADVLGELVDSFDYDLIPDDPDTFNSL